MRLTLVLTTLIALFLAAPALAGDYVGGGTFVVKTGFGTLLDNGGVVCQGTDGSGIAGGCLPFVSDPRKGAFVAVNDDAAGNEVAFQVCIDNNGDGICGGPQTDPRCFDQIFFSHNDEGRFFNPLGPLPTSFLEGCAANGGFAGYVVLLCQGVHQAESTDGPSAHSHSVTQGTITLAVDGSGYGNFCGGGNGGGAVDLGANEAVAKGYVIV